MSFRQPGEVHIGSLAGVRITAAPEMLDDPDGTPFALTIRQRTWVNVIVTRAGRRWHYEDLFQMLDRIHAFIGFAAGAESEMLEVKGNAAVLVRTFGPPRVRPRRIRGTVWVLYRRRRAIDSALQAPIMLFRRGGALQVKLLRGFGARRAQTLAGTLTVLGHWRRSRRGLYCRAPAVLPLPRSSGVSPASSWRGCRVPGAHAGSLRSMPYPEACGSTYPRTSPSRCSGHATT